MVSCAREYGLKWPRFLTFKYVGVVHEARGSDEVLAYSSGIHFAGLYGGFA
jgi:hypothetical protein